MTTATSTDVFHSPPRYGDMEGWRDEIMRLHEAGPIHCIEAPGFRPFWAVIGHPEVMDIERQSKLFKTEPEAILISDEMLRQRLQPAIITYNSLISACEKGQDPKGALQVFDKIQ